jgi:branched-chain amino acid transport system substrate-binding protein
MKRNAKTIIAGFVALTMSHAVMAKDIKVAVVGAMSGPVAQWGDMEFNGARQAIKDINARAALKATSWLALNSTTPATRNRPSR